MFDRRPLTPAIAAASGPRDASVSTTARPAAGSLGDVRRRQWRVALLKAAIAYVASRFVVLVSGGLVAAADAYRAIQNGETKPASAGTFVLRTLTSWDGLWYLSISRDGYPRSVIPHVSYFDPDARAAFFPLFPWLTRVVNAVLPGGDTASALLLNAVLGAVFVFLVGMIAKRVYDVRIAGRAMILICFFPGSFVLSFAYAEALLLTLAAATLLALLHRRWVLAGVAAAFATAARPNGVALVLACLVAAIYECRREGRAVVRPFIAVALAPLGFVAFQLYLGQRTGEALVWFRVQREAWEEGASFGWTAITKTWHFTLHPFASAVNTVTALCVAATVGFLIVLWRAKLPPALTAYCLGIIGLMLLPATVTARPRFLLTAFPVLIAFPAVFPRKDDDWWALLLALNAAGLVAVTTLYGVWAAIP